METILRKILQNVLLFAALIAAILSVDSILLNNNLSKNIVQRILSSKNFKIEIESFSINYFSGKIKARNATITNAQNKVLANVDIEEGSFSLKLTKKNKLNRLRYELRLKKASACLKEIDLPFIKIKNDPINISGYKLETFYSLFHKNYKGEIHNNFNEKINFEVKPLKLICSTQVFQFGPLKLEGEIEANYENNNFINANCKGKINNYQSLYLDLQNYYITNKKSYNPCIKFNLESILCDFHFNAKKFANNTANIVLDLSEISSPQSKYAVKNKRIVLNFEKHITNAKIYTKKSDKEITELAFFNLNFDAKSYDFTISSDLEDIVKVIMSSHDKSSKLLNDIFEHFHKANMQPKLLLKGNLKNLNQSLDINIEIPQYFNYLLTKKTKDNSMGLTVCCNLNMQKKQASLCINNTNKVIEAIVDVNFNPQHASYIANLTGQFKLNEQVMFRECKMQKGIIPFSFILQDSKKGGYILDTKIDLQNCLFDAIFIEKTHLHPFLCKIITNVEGDSISSTLTVSQNKRGNIIEGNVNIKTQYSQIFLKKVAYMNNAYKGSVYLEKTGIKINIDGQRVDFSEFDLLSFLKHFIKPEQKISINCKVAEILMKNSNILKNATLDLNFDKHLVYNCDFSAQVNETGTINIITNHNPGNLLNSAKKNSFEISTSNFGAVMSSIGIKEVVEEGKLKAVINIKDDKELGICLEGKLHVNSFYVNNPPKILRLLSVTIFSPFFLQQKRALFHKLKSKFSVQQGEIIISNLFANGPTFSFSITKGKFIDDTLECNGYIIPSFIIPNLPFFIPVPYKHKKKYNFNS